ncbi:DNA invertase Pin-like site-specific DNA recombinase [Scopulibacillus darangshiensis]|uniref:DNA invertase Pin-like site-specific DNA recombinase n=1 Tax=Scopulibacillus darangshiensis TaxID=442528 RepID=A0A4R2P8P0_9BACL|nr:recombinase family protein [Scopulibacillus darangshiensis]TCP30215.1 DNA invertase Pin-like site-specific DNA recombinase [Scopulibacillus darangshiensis]
MSRKIGYARVSTAGQELVPQIEALKQAGAEHIIQEKKSGKDLNRQGILEAVSLLQEGDTLIVTKLDRIARNLKDGIHLIEELLERGISLKVLNIPMIGDSDTTSKLIRNILLSVAEWEREMILERQREGIAIAKANGKYKTKPKKYTDKNPALLHALDLLANRSTNKMTVKDICQITGVTRSSLYAIAKDKGIL